MRLWKRTVEQSSILCVSALGNSNTPGEQSRKKWICKCSSCTNQDLLQHNELRICIFILYRIKLNGTIVLCQLQKETQHHNFAIKKMKLQFVVERSLVGYGVLLI